MNLDAIMAHLVTKLDLPADEISGIRDHIKACPVGKKSVLEVVDGELKVYYDDDPEYEANNPPAGGE
jgi:hypothetical protein